MASDELERLKLYVEELRRQLPAGPKSAILVINGVDRQLLALRGYLCFIRRHGVRRLERMWAWTEEEYNRFAGTEAGLALRNEIVQVIQTFNRNNPGHRLVTARTHRPLETQVRLWNRNASVARIGSDLRRVSLRELQRTETVRVTPPYLQALPQSIPGGRQCLVRRTVPIRQRLYPKPVSISRQTFNYLIPQESRFISQSIVPPSVEIRKPHPKKGNLLERFRHYLERRGLVGSPTNATPGLSRHGTGRAIDFVVYRGRQQILTTGNPGRWRTTGFAERLQEAIRTSGPHFNGPLAAPDEPWHYNYDNR